MRHFAAHVGVSLFFPFSPKNIYLKADTTMAYSRRMSIKTQMQKKSKKKKKKKEDAQQFRVWVLLPSFGMQEVKSKGDTKKKI